jgi:hypothetical protein
MKELNRETTTANLLPEALSLPSRACSVSGARSVFSLLSFVIFVPSIAVSRHRAKKLFPLEHGWALLEERPCAFGLIFGRARHSK